MVEIRLHPRRKNGQFDNGAMHLNLRTLFGEHKATQVAGRVEPHLEAASPANPSSRPRVVLCASQKLRERLAASTKYEFIPYGNADPEILRENKQSPIAGVLIH